MTQFNSFYGYKYKYFHSCTIKLPFNYVICLKTFLDLIFSIYSLNKIKSNFNNFILINCSFKRPSVITRTNDIPSYRVALLI